MHPIMSVQIGSTYKELGSRLAKQTQRCEELVRPRFGLRPRSRWAAYWRTAVAEIDARRDQTIAPRRGEER